MTASNRLRRVTTDIGIAILVIGGVLAGSLVVEHFSRGEWHASVMQFQRFQHMSSVLWQQHKVHHMDEQLNAITTGRQNWLEEFFRIPIIALPLTILFKFDKTDPFSLGLVGAAVGLALGSWGYFIHANLKLHLGFLSRWFAGPQVHRVHHSRLPQHRDRNFAAFFPLWDVLFGTYFAPARDEFPPTGVDGEKEFRSLGEATILPFREWSRMYRAWRLRRKLMLESILHE